MNIVQCMIKEIIQSDNELLELLLIKINGEMIKHKVKSKHLKELEYSQYHNIPIYVEIEKEDLK